MEKLQEPAAYIDAVLERVKKEHIVATYGVKAWTDSLDFLEQYAQQTGKLLKHGEPDVPTVAKMVLNDFIRGKLPHFVQPPEEETNGTAEDKDGPDNEEDPPKKKLRTLDGSAPASSDAPQPAIVAPKQNISDIVVRSEYAEDKAQSNSENEMAGDDEIISSLDESDEIGWDDVFASVASLETLANPQSVPEEPRSTDENVESNSAEIKEESPRPQPEEKSGKKRKRSVSPLISPTRSSVFRPFLTPSR